MDRHGNETTEVRSILGSLGDNTNRYNPGRVYNTKKSGKEKKSTKKKSTTTASSNRQRLSFTVTYFQYPGIDIYKKLDRETDNFILENELKCICSGKIQLFTDMDQAEVKTKIFTYLKTEKKLNINESGFNHIYVRREGRDRKIKHVSTDPEFIFDAVAFKDLSSGTPNKNILVLLITPLPGQPSHSRTGTLMSVNQDNYAFTEVENSMNYSSDDSDLPNAFGTNPNLCNSSTPQDQSSSKRKKSPFVNKPRKSQKKQNVVVLNSSSETENPEEYHLNFKDFDKISKNAYCMECDNNTLLSVLTILRHLAPFMHSLNLAIELNKDNASKLELSLAQVMILFENENLKSCWNMALSELATVLRLHPNFSVGDTFKVLLNALRDLDSETWSQFFFLPILSSELVTEYLGENGFEHVPDIDIETIKFDDKEVNIKDLLNTFMERNECKFPYDDEKYTIQKGESVYARKFFRKLPEVLFLEFKDSSKLVLVDEIKKINLHDTKDFSKGVLSLTAVVAICEDKHIIALRHKRNKFVKVYANGSVHTAEMSLKDFVNKKLPLCQKVFVVYADSKPDDNDGANTVETLKDEPNIDSIEVFGQFLFKRLSTKKAIQSSETSLKRSNDGSLQGEFDRIIEKLNAQLSLIEGQDELKQHIFEWAHHTLMQDLKRKNNIGSLTRGEMVSNMHMILSGNPGTGKTMIARCLASILHELGVLESPDIVEVQKENIVSGYVSATAKDCKKVIESAFGKLMFIDEAYQLVPNKETDPSTHSNEAIETIMRYMNPPPSGQKDLYPVFIFAGYPKDMDKFLEKVNRGVRRRIKERFEFKDYTPEELSRITLNKMLRQKLQIPYSVEKTLVSGFMLIPPSVRSEHNASLSEDLYKIVVKKQEMRLGFCSSIDELSSYSKEDFSQGIQTLVKKFVLDPHKIEKHQEVWLHIPGVGLVPGSPITPMKH